MDATCRCRTAGRCRTDPRSPRPGAKSGQPGADAGAGRSAGADLGEHTITVKATPEKGNATDVGVKVKVEKKTD